LARTMPMAVRIHPGATFAERPSSRTPKMKTSKRNKHSRTTRKRGSGLRAARGYTATEAQLAEIILIECCILENAMEASRIMGRMQKCAAQLNELRRKIREAV
jgi:hypothetical protein